MHPMRGALAQRRAGSCRTVAPAERMLDSCSLTERRQAEEGLRRLEHQFAGRSGWRRWARWPAASRTTSTISRRDTRYGEMALRDAPRGAGCGAIWKVSRRRASGGARWWIASWLQPQGVWNASPRCRKACGVPRPADGEICRPVSRQGELRAATRDAGDPTQVHQVVMNWRPTASRP